MTVGNAGSVTLTNTGKSSCTLFPSGSKRLFRVKQIKVAQHIAMKTKSVVVPTSRTRRRAFIFSHKLADDVDLKEGSIMLKKRKWLVSTRRLALQLGNACFSSRSTTLQFKPTISRQPRLSAGTRFRNASLFAEMQL